MSHVAPVNVKYVTHVEMTHTPCIDDDQYAREGAPVSTSDRVSGSCHIRGRVTLH